MPMPMMEMFDRSIQMRMGQCHVHRWMADLLPIVAADGDPLGLESLETHRVLSQGRPEAVSGRVVLVVGASSGIGRAAPRRRSC